MKRLPDLYCTTLGTLPSELFDIVLGHISGDFRSLKRLRLSGTTRSHDEVILEHLFRRVSLSMLKSSVDEFTSIAANPHLARHVRVLVWQELPSYTGRLCMFDADIAAADSDRDSRKLAELFRQREEVFDRVAGACWMRMVDDSITRHHAYHWAAGEYFWSWFSPALASMPQVNRLVVEAMPPSTRIRGVFDPRHGGGRRPVTVKMLYESRGTRRASRRVSKKPPLLEAASSMVCWHIRQALQLHVCTRLASSQTSPRALASIWEDTTGLTYDYTSFTYGVISRDIWKGVLRLTLKIDGIDVETMRDACGALSAARGLQRLDLISETAPKGIVADVGSGFLDHVSRPSNALLDLECLRLEGCHLSMVQLVRFIRAHRCGALERLVLQDCLLHQVDAQDLDGLVCRNAIQSALRTLTTVPGAILYTCDYRLPMTPEMALIRAIMSLEGQSQRDVERRRAAVAGAHISLFVKPYRFSAEAFTHRWMWGRKDGDETVYYWRAEGPLSEPTSTWAFVRGASGEKKYGDDPRVFWPDWDEDRPGDVAWPTPFCNDFKKFVHKSRWTARYDPAYKVPEGAIEFEETTRDELVRQEVW